MIVRRRLSPSYAILVSILIASMTVPLATGAGSGGFATRYAIKLVYVSIGMLAMLSSSETHKRIKGKKR